MLSQADTPLLQALWKASRNPHVAFYTPGHKRGQGVSMQHRSVFGSSIFQVDLPELPELDDLFAPESVILAAQQLAAAAFGADQTWFLVNGSTCGVEAAILATCGPGDKVIVPRNAHQSVISGLILSGAIPVWVMPTYETDWCLMLGVTAAAIAAALAEHPDAKAVVIVSPTYEGVCSDIATIATTVHSYDIPLIVDAAHGPHLCFHEALPPSALSCGADIVIHSAHKVLAAFTQAALLHVQGQRCDHNRLKQALRMTQSSSPSYLLLGSLDAARHQMANHGQSLMERTMELAHAARVQLQRSAIPVLDAAQTQPTHQNFQQDMTRLTVNVAALDTTGFAADIWLQEQGVIAELPMPHSLTFVISLGNSANDIEQMVKQLQRLPATGKGEPLPSYELSPVPQLSPRDAFFAATQLCDVSHVIGQLSADTICVYPPGIPNLMPGEVITAAVLKTLKIAQTAGAHISGLVDPTLKTLRILKPSEAC